uniref:Uncharacterized protein n=1 Tax=Hyaloperonospora arabidopsidis (strain Emoy2) TaxID=559515 RepID=M4BJ91_HYAAE
MMSRRANSRGDGYGSHGALSTSSTYVHDISQCGTIMTTDARHCHLSALATREHKGEETVVQGARMHACLTF